MKSLAYRRLFRYAIIVRHVLENATTIDRFKRDQKAGYNERLRL
jgi:hypothetical protein